MLLHRPDRSLLLDRDHFLGVASKNVDLSCRPALECVQPVILEEPGWRDCLSSHQGLGDPPAELVEALLDPLSRDAVGAGQLGCGLALTTQELAAKLLSYSYVQAGVRKIAPSEAELTRAAYRAKTPWVNRGGGGDHCARR